MRLAAGPHVSKAAPSEDADRGHVFHVGLRENSAHARGVESSLGEAAHQLGCIAVPAPLGHDRIADLDSAVGRWRSEIAATGDDDGRNVVSRAPNRVPYVPDGNPFAPFDESIV